MSNYPPKARNERKPVRMPASCRSANGLRDDGWLEDISAEGCCFVTRATCFRIGSHIILRPDGLEGITGIVRWVHANRCGVAFSSPLYGAVLDHLCRRFGDASAPVTAETVPQYRRRPALRGLL